MTGFNRISIITVLAILAGSPIMAQQGNPVVPNQDTQMTELQTPLPQPYIGRITGSEVNIRSGPAEVYYPVGRLDLDQMVVVHEEKYGSWARVEPTPQCFSYIAQEFVSLTGLAPKTDATTASANQQDTQTEQQAMTPAELTALVGQETLVGEVVGNRVRVRAGSVDVVPPANASEVQTRLEAGDEVRVIGARDNFYKIECPPECYFWVALDFIERIQPVTPETLDVMQEEEQQAAEEQAQAQQNLDQMSLDRQEYLAVAEMLTTELAKPMAERDYQSTRERLETLMANTQSSSIKRTCEILSQQIARCETALNLWKLSHQQDQQLQDTLAKINKDKQKVELLVSANPLGTKTPDGIVVKGTLEKSAVFTAENKNERFLVLDADNRIIYYAIPGVQDLDLSPYVGKKVSLLGQAQYDAVTRIRILRVTNIVEQTVKIKDDKKAEEKVIK